ncbi:unnamed protein product, partial [Coccothraustes coccothraustes]
LSPGRTGWTLPRAWAGSKPCSERERGGSDREGRAGHGRGDQFCTARERLPWQRAFQQPAASSWRDPGAGEPLLAASPPSACGFPPSAHCPLQPFAKGCSLCPRPQSAW